MHNGLLATKLYIPSTRAKIIPRNHLVERINEGLHRKLTLISAPAGFGKTTLISDWVGSSRQPVAWLSLDDGDNDPTRFLSYCAAALHTIAPTLGDEISIALKSLPQASSDFILTILVNGIAEIPDSFVLILDDYHVIDNQAVHQVLAFLLDHLPPQMRMVIATREDPQLPLARLRAHDQLTELRAKDLRFSVSEAAGFLNQTMGLRLSSEEIAALGSRTEGWVAGLQLAGISIQGHQDPASYIKAFTGSDRFVMDYLVEEVVKQQPESIQAFLLQTSILDRTCGSLCDAVLPGAPATGQETLEYLERANLFIIPLDDERRWYRYHHLFAELLRTQLVHTLSDQIPELHRRASDWYSQNDLPGEAMKHALAIQDWSRAADIIERFAEDLVMRGQNTTLLNWLEMFPASVRLDRIKVGLVYAWVLNMANQLDLAEQHLDQLMPLAQAMPSILGELYSIRVMIAAYRADMPAVVELAEHALSLLPLEKISARSRVLLSLGVAYDEMGGEIAAARDAFREAFERGKLSRVPAALTAFAHLPEIEWLQGNLRAASRMYDQAIELAEKWGGQSSIAMCRVHRGRASLLYEWNDLEGAARALDDSIHVSELWNNPRFLVHSYGLSAMLMQALGQVENARAMIGRAEQITRDSFSPPPTLGSLAFYQITLWAEQGDFQAIAEWEQHHTPEWQSQIGRIRGALVIALAHARIARFYQQHDPLALGQARALIRPEIENSLASGLMLNVVRLLILDALASYAQGDAASASTVLQRALAIAEPENYVRSFLDIGKPMEEFLAWSISVQSPGDPRLGAYVRDLLSQFGTDEQIESGRPTGDTFIEPLTERELQVLRLIAAGLSNREIGERLFLALDTVKGHNRRIFEKLHVQRRTEAIARARELGLL